MSLQDGARRMGIELSDEQVRAFELYRSTLLEWNQRFNLTAITDPAEIDAKHFLDSLSCLAALPTIDGGTVDQWLGRSITAVDVGAGAGFPGLPMRIVWPGLRLTLLEATGKKCRFMEHVVAELGLENVAVVNARAEDFGQGSGRGQFDLGLVRAVSRISTLLEYTLPLLRIGGWLVAQKGRDPEQELVAAQAALNTLGGSLHDVLAVDVPGMEAERNLVVVVKASPTPGAYPRRAGIPQRQPL